MTKREAKKWACGLASALLRSDIQTCPEITEEGPNHDKKLAAMNELIVELEKREEVECE